MEISPTEAKLLEQLRLKISDLNLSEEFLQDKNLVRWIRARNCNLVQAEEMIRKSVEWRRKMDFEKMKTTCKFPSNWETEVLPGFFLGEDNEGLPVIYILFGRCDVEGAIRSEGEELLRNFILQCFECLEKLCLSRTKGKRSMGQITVIFDLEGLSFSQVTSYTFMQFSIKMVIMTEANYPELLRKGFCVNSPWAFQAIYKVAKRLVPERTMKKVAILGSDKNILREEIGKFVPFHAFPQRYGGDLPLEKENEMKKMADFDGLLPKWGPNYNC